MEVQLNYLAIFVITFAAFAGGALWHGPLFGKLWMRIHHGKDTMSKEEMAKGMEGMWKTLLTEFLMTLMMITTLAFMIKIISIIGPVHIAFMAWLGFVVPMTISNIIWGGDKKEWMITKILVSISYRLIVFLSAGYILSVWL